MKFTFYKYQGTGNDFVMIDNRQNLFPKNNTQLIKHLCNRRFGIGADGLILLENHTEYNFKMVYYNADGNESTMCGNGGRCLVAFAKQLNIIFNKAEFEAIDGYHFATIDKKNTVSLQMIDINQIKVEKEYTFLNTGSPHHVVMVDDVKKVNIKEKGAQIRYSELYGEVGSNVNFVQQINSDTFSVRTYERGVEDETLSCGTGVTATAIAMFMNKKTESNKVNLKVEGGQLTVGFSENNGIFTNIFLIGPATFVYKGEISI